MSKVNEQANWAKRWVDLVAGHDDEDLAVRVAMLDDLKAYVDGKVAEATARKDAHVADLLAPKAEPAE